MGVTNRAFIKAYAWDRSEASPPTPHLVFAPANAKHGTSEQSAADAAGQNSPSGTMTDPPAKLGIPRQPSGTLPPNRTNRPAGVTSFVPAPHIPLNTMQSARTSERKPLNVSKPTEEPKPEVPASKQKQTTSQPLSNFTKQEPVQEKFEPAFGVPEFRWPETCAWFDQLVRPDYAELFEMIQRETHETAPVIAITGAVRGEGRSTSLLSIAQESARQGMRTAIVDGDFAQPGLAEMLAVATTTGWEDVLTGETMLSEAMIYAEREKLSLLPLGETVRDKHAIASSLHTAISLAVLSQHYDLVLVDVGPLCEEPSAAGTLLRRAKFTGALLVQDTRDASADSHLLFALERLAKLKIPALGVIENFGTLTDFAPQTDSQQTNAA